MALAPAGIEQVVAQLISKVFIHLDDSDRQLMKKFGITVTQFWALVHLHDEEGRSLSELATLLICDKSNVTSVVDKLEEAGLAERKAGKAGDRRFRRVVLTAEGQRLRRQAMAAREQLIEQRLRAVAPENVSQLTLLLQHLADTLQQQFDEHTVERLIDQATEHGQSA
jgi:MarR family transcriptional regulator, organic hydroperoxide resistance regulator